MAGETHTVIVAVIEQDGCHLGTSCDEDSAVTLLAVVSEDPASWADIAAYWPRYRTPQVPEFADGLAIHSADLAEVRAAIGQHESWVVIDLVQKRVMTGRDFDLIGRDQAFTMVDESGKQHYPLSVHLPPWWELNEQMEANAVDRKRERAWSVPRVNREVLFGEAMVDDLAKRILGVVQSEPWRSSGARENKQSRYKFTIQVHREWLMTPRDELGGKFPRQMLHGGHDWIDHLVSAQRIRFEDGGELVAVPTGVTGYDEAPMGREEIVMYFDLCRELISAGWQWCIENQIGSKESADPRRKHQLVMYLTDVKQQWLASPFEGGSPPQFIIECSRRRVPHGPGVPIVGMEDRPPEEHTVDCDCPICSMMADGIFGPGFECIDGHHLELDDEFAFSLNETREAWEAEQAEFADFSAKVDRRIAEREACDKPEPDELAPVWSGQLDDGPLPGDSRGHLKLAFMLAEVVGILQANGAPHGDIKRLNDKFTRFRQSDRKSLPMAGRELNEHLEKLAGCHPELISRAADLQSRIVELIRHPEFIEEDPSN